MCYNQCMNNQAFIDGQNLYCGTVQHPKVPWKINHRKFRVYLKEKYHIEKAYYFLGAIKDDCEDLYDELQEAGFILVFREHNSSMISKKKGNVDTDIVFTIMRKITEREKIENIFLVSGDGDYIRMVKYLISKAKFGKILAPTSHNFSSLYRSLDSKYYSFLDEPDVKRKIELGSKRRK